MGGGVLTDDAADMALVLTNTLSVLFAAVGLVLYCYSMCYVHCWPFVSVPIVGAFCVIVGDALDTGHRWLEHYDSNSGVQNFLAEQYLVVEGVGFFLLAWNAQLFDMDRRTKDGIFRHDSGELSQPFAEATSMGSELSFVVEGHLTPARGVVLPVLLVVGALGVSVALWVAIDWDVAELVWEVLAICSVTVFLLSCARTAYRLRSHIAPTSYGQRASVCDLIGTLGGWRGACFAFLFALPLYVVGFVYVQKRLNESIDRVSQPTILSADFMLFIACVLFYRNSRRAL